MKKVFLSLVLIVVMTSGAFAQDKQVKNFASGEVGFFGAGARYEHMLNPKIGIGVNAYYNWLVSGETGIDFSFRVHPGKVFYFGIGLGFHISRSYLSLLRDFLEEDRKVKSWGNAIGVAITPEIGWRIDFGKPGGFFLSPGIKIPVTLGVKRLGLTWWSDSRGDFSRFAWSVGVVPYIGLGGCW